MFSKTSSTQQNNKLNTGSLFTIEDLSLSFGDIHALRSIDMNIKQGEIVFITGASGAGKTSLLKVLSGEVQPDSGKFRSLLDINKAMFLSRVFQDARFVEDLSCIDNLEMVYNTDAYSNYKEFTNDLKDLCRIIGITDRLHLKISQANGGLRQKIAIVRALLTRPNVLLADEPTNSLDLENSRKIFDILNLYNVKRGLTVIWSTHNRELVKKFTGRILHLDKGKLIYSGHACFI